MTLTEAGRDRVLENAADLPDAVTIIRVRPSQGGFRNDPFAVRVLALEKYDPETGTARKNDIMRHRVLLPRPDVEHADDPEDALAICMDRHAQVRLDVIAELLGAASEQEARDRLGTLVFHDPAEGRLVPAPGLPVGRRPRETAPGRRRRRGRPCLPGQRRGPDRGDPPGPGTGGNRGTARGGVHHPRRGAAVPAGNTRRSRRSPSRSPRTAHGR